MTPRLILLNQPHIDLRGFVDIVGQDVVNGVDRKNIQPAAKFAELVDELLSEDVDPYAHLSATFYIEMPCDLECEFRAYPYINGIRFNTVLDRFVSKGLMTTSFDQWAGFLKWSSRRTASKFLRAYSNQMFRLLSHHKFFSMLRPTELHDKTFVLE